MSTPSTPARSGRVPSATPSLGRSKSPIELTPRSKVRALMASFEHGSDDDKASNYSSRPFRATGNTERTNDAAAAASNLNDNDSDADAEDAPVQKPMGRMAARLLVQEKEDKGNSIVNEDGEDVYARIKKQLMSKKEPQQPEKRSLGLMSGPKAPVSDDDESSGKASNSRKRKLTNLPRPALQQSLSSASLSRHSSPGLFDSSREASPVRRLSPSSARQEDSDPDFPVEPRHNARFQELVARKRAERKAREEENRKREEEKVKRLDKLASRRRYSRREDSESEGDEDIEMRMTQQARPTRKASKKALEELNRETQRMNRNMQLAHQAKTKKKFTTKDLFAKFGFVPEEPESIPAQESHEHFTCSVSPSSDVEDQREHDTPPTSPPSQGEQAKEVQIKESSETVHIASGDSDEELPTLNEILTQPLSKVDKKGKGRASEFEHVPTHHSVAKSIKPAASKRLHIIYPKRPTSEEIDLDSDDDLEIVKSKKRFPVFDLLPKEKTKEPRSLLALRALANLTSPGRHGPKSRVSKNPRELQADLQRRARLQAKLEREERIIELKARGILVQTEEEIEKDQLEFENMFEKAQEDAIELAKKEKEDAKREGKETGYSPLDSEDEEDGDYEVSAGEQEEEEDVELSGSEEEGGDDEGEEAEDDEDVHEAESNSLLDDVAEEDDKEEQPQPDNYEGDADASEEEEPTSTLLRSCGLTRPRHIIAEDESDNEELRPSAPQQPAQDDGMAAFDFQNAHITTLGLTQMFAGTMANLQSQSQNDGMGIDTQRDPLNFLRNIPMATLPNLDATMVDVSQNVMVLNSHVHASQNQRGESQTPESHISLDLSQLQSQPQTAFPHTQVSELPEPTQDAGFELSRSPAGLPPAPHSTVDTVILPVAESPVVRKRGRLQRRREAIPVLSDVDDDDAAHDAESDGDEEFEISTNAFNIMRKAAKKPPVGVFDKKKSEAKDMVQEQAEESEDEYAGLGGQSDDESGGEEDEEVRAMIDESDVKVDEREIAAFYHAKDKDDDQKKLNKLYKDITTGGLRRRHGETFELSDEEDELRERRKRKQQEHAKMLKALREDENINKIASNPKKEAFFRALADHEDDPDLDFLNGPEPEADAEASESTQDASVPDSQQEGNPKAASKVQWNPLKRKAPPTDSQEKENRPPPHLRRTAADETIRKPVSITDIRESVSFLINEPQMIPESQFSASESEDEDEVDSASGGPSSRRPIVDRLTLSRSASVAEPTAGSTSAMAFHAPSAAMHQPGFRIPSLIRRATSNISAKISTSSTGSTATSGASTSIEGTGPRRGGNGKSNIHYQAREAERRAALEKAEKRRQEQVRKKVKVGSRRSVLGVLGCGDEGFE